MKTCLNIPAATHYFIDIAPLAARYAALTAMMVALTEAGQLSRVMELGHKVLRLVKIYTQADTHNQLLERKLAMLIRPQWRDRVLKELGGMKRLASWDAAFTKVMARIKRGVEPAEPESQNPSWLHTPERIEESEQLKAKAQEHARAATHPNIVRDKYKMDREGHFRLAPLPRGPVAKREPKIYTKLTISDYGFNPVPFAPVETLGPASVWPREFYASLAAQAGKDSPFTPARRASRKERRKQKKLVRTRVVSAEPRPTLPLHIIIAPKTYRSIFENAV